MTSTTDITQRDATIVNDLGLHARAAAKLAKTAHRANHDVWLEFGSERVDAKQVIDILTLAASKGDRVTVRIEQPADADVLVRIIELFNNGFGE
jgi:phosphocarrier protein